MMRALWRAFLQGLAAPVDMWRSSLLARTVTLTVGLSGLAVTLIGGYMSLTIADNLFAGRTDQILGETTRAATVAQTLFDNSVTASGTIDVETANEFVLELCVIAVTLSQFEIQRFENLIFHLQLMNK